MLARGSLHDKHSNMYYNSLKEYLNYKPYNRLFRTTTANNIVKYDLPNHKLALEFIIRQNLACFPRFTNRVLIKDWPTKSKCISN